MGNNKIKRMRWIHRHTIGQEHGDTSQLQDLDTDGQSERDRERQLDSNIDTSVH